MKTTRIKSTLTLLALASALSACAPVMVGSVVGTAMVASDRRSSGAQLEDEGIEVRAGSAIRENFGTNTNVNVTSFNRQVLITGEVPNAAARAQVESLITKLPNVRSVVNELAIGQASTAGQRATDALTTTRVKAAMVDSNDIFANTFKVVTERDTVYLMGRVTQREAQRATEIARKVSSVKRVVRVFEIITEEELKALQPKPPKQEPTTPQPVLSGTGQPVTTQVPATTSPVR